MGRRTAVEVTIWSEPSFYANSTLSWRPNSCATIGKAAKMPQKCPRRGSLPNPEIRFLAERQSILKPSLIDLLSGIRTVRK